MPAEGIDHVDLALQHFRHDDRQRADWRALLMIAQGEPPLGRATLARLPEVQALKATARKLRSALDKLGKAGTRA